MVCTYVSAATGTRCRKPVLSTDASWANMTYSGAGESGSVAYATRLASGVTQLSLPATAIGQVFTIVVNPTNAFATVVKAAPAALVAGVNTFGFTITAQNLIATTTYAIEVTVAEPTSLCNDNSWSLAYTVGTAAPVTITSADTLAPIELPSETTGTTVLLEFTLPTGAFISSPMLNPGSPE